MKFIHKRTEDNQVVVTACASKKQIEQDLSNAPMTAIVLNKERGLIPRDIFKDPTTGLVQLTDKQYKDLIFAQNPHLTDKGSVHIAEVDKDFEFPPNIFRGAWRWDGKKITHDFKAAVEYQLVDFRNERDELLKKYDGLQSRANDLQDEEAIQEVKLKKQQLRDSTDVLKTLEPSSIEDILNATPDLSGY